MSNYEFETQDVVIDLAENHAPYKVGVFFFRQYAEHGSPLWHQTDNPDTSGWGWPSASPLRDAIHDAGLKVHDDCFWSTEEKTVVHYENGTKHEVSHCPVFYFKDRATFMRLKLYM